MKKCAVLFVLSAFPLVAAFARADSFRVTPYVQNPATDAITVKWYTETNEAATISWWVEGGTAQSLQTTPERAAELYYSDTDLSSQSELGPIQTIPWEHRARLTGLTEGTTYRYRVELSGGASYEKTFKTVPDRNTPVRFICYSDSETEPESTGKFESWEKPPSGSSYHPDKYFVDSTVGYASNIVQMVRRNPDFYLIAGDLAQYGYEQRDWDEFWRHNAGVRNDPAGSAPIFAAPGNHDYVNGTINNNNRAAYDGGEAAISRYLRYFEYPSNGVDFGDGGPDRSELFYRVDYGRVTVISLDTNNGDDSDPEKDSCTVLYRDDSKVPSEYAPTGQQRPCRAPDFNPGTPQFNWLTNNLADAQAKGQFVFVLNHHMPHSVGYHNRHNKYRSNSYSSGDYEPYSAVAVRVLQPYLLKYGVTAWICGHDEIFEQSQVTGPETLPDGTTRTATLNIFDVGNSGDGLRGGGTAGENMRGEANLYETWRAHVDEPEVYDSNGVLTSGGKHYGHLEVNVEPDGETGNWKCTLTPVHVFVNKVNGKAATFERRAYSVETVITKSSLPPLPEGYRYDSQGHVECQLTVAPGAGGPVRVDGQAVGSGEFWVREGATVTLTAEKSGTTVFAAWTGDTSTIVSGFATSPEIKVVLSAPLALTATWTTSPVRYWNPTTKTQSGKDSYYFWSTAANWLDANGATGKPVAGDTVIFGSDSKSSGAYQVSEGNSSNPLYEVCFSNKTTVSVNQGWFALKTGGRGLQYLRNANNIGNWAGLRLCGDGEVPVNIANKVTYAMQKACLIGTGAPTVVKVGPGTFVNCNQSGNYTYTVKKTLLREGTWDITLQNVLDGCIIGFDGNDGSQVLQYCYSSYKASLQIKDGGIFETNGVANTTHAISANGKDQPVIFTGTPKFNPMVFSGRLTKGAGIRWNPFAADYAFVFSNAVSDTNGRLLLDKGTIRLVTGASFTNLAEVAVAEGAGFEVDEGSGAKFASKALTLAGAGAKLRLGAGVNLSIDAATLAGTALAATTYSSTGSGGTRKVAWIEGDGTVTVSTGPANADTWRGAGANTSTATDENWLNGSAPDLEAGGLLATFATGGTEARLPGTLAAQFAGLVLNPAFGGVSFAFAADDATATLGGNGIQSTTAASPVVWTMGWPITVAAAQTWNLAANNTLQVAAPISGSAALAVSGAGAVEFNATSTHSGTKDLSCAHVRIAADNALGTSGNTVTYHHLTSKLTFAGDITLDSPFYSSDQVESFTSFMTVEPNAHVTFNGNFGYLSDGGITFGAGSVTTFRGGVRFNTDGMKGRLAAYGSGTVIVTNKPISAVRSYIGQSNNPITLVLAAANNFLNDSSYWAHFPVGGLVTLVDNALTTNTATRIRFDDAEFDLSGHDQRLDLLATTAKTRVTSAEPARLTIRSTDAGGAQEGDQGGTNRVDRAVYSGQVSVAKAGPYPHVFGATSTSTGAVSVTQGILRMAADGKWPNATEVIVGGGTLALQNADAFGSNAVWRVTTDTAPTVQLDFTGTNTASKLYVDGLRQSGGFWGPVGSGAEHEATWLTGTGFVNVIRRGFALSLK